MLVLTLFLVQAVLAQTPPSAESVKTWAGYPQDFELNREQILQGDFTKLGDPIWIYFYQNKSHSLESYVIAVFKPGSLWSKPSNLWKADRSNTLQIIEDQVRKSASLHDDFYKDMIRIETAPSGRKTYFTILGFGPGGTIIGGFSFLPKYDLLVTKIFDGEDDMPNEKHMKNPVKSPVRFPDFFKLAESAISETKKSEQGAAANP